MLKPKNVLILLAFFGVSGVLSSVIKAISPPSAPKATSSTPARPAPRCQTAEANIRDNLTLYRDAQCTEAIGKISGIGRTPSGEAMVFIIESDGTEQQVTRQSTKDWFVIN